MNAVALLERVPWSPLIIIALTLGLAPFSPPHIVEKMVMLAEGNLTRAVDWFDFFLHGTPWIVLALKALLWFRSG